VQQRSAPRTVLRFERTFPNRTHAPPPQLREKYYAAFVQTTMTRTSQHQLSRSRRVTAAVAAAAAAVAVFFVAASSFDSANALAFRQHQHQHNNNNYMKSDVAVSRRGALATAAASAFGLVSASAGFGGVGVLPAYAAAGGGMTKADYDRIKLGYQQITYLLDNFEQETTTCRENGGECKRDADPIRRVLGLRSTSDPLFQIEKVFDKVKDMDLDIDKLERFFEASEEFNSATNMSNSMAFISQVRTRSKIKTTIQGKNVAKQRNLHLTHTCFPFLSVPSQFGEYNPVRTLFLLSALTAVYFQSVACFVFFPTSQLFSLSSMRRAADKIKSSNSSSKARSKSRRLSRRSKRSWRFSISTRPGNKKRKETEEQNE